MFLKAGTKKAGRVLFPARSAPQQHIEPRWTSCAGVYRHPSRVRTKRASAGGAVAVTGELLSLCGQPAAMSNPKKRRAVFVGSGEFSPAACTCAAVWRESVGKQALAHSSQSAADGGRLRRGEGRVIGQSCGHLFLAPRGPWWAGFCQGRRAAPRRAATSRSSPRRSSAERAHEWRRAGFGRCLFALRDMSRRPCDAR